MHIHSHPFWDTENNGPLFPATNSSDDEAKETPKAASGAGAGNGPVSAANKGKKQKVIQDKENRKAIKVIIIRTHTYTFRSI